MQKLTKICSSDTFDTVYFFSMLCMLNYTVIYSLSDRERVAVNVQGNMCPLAGLKIVPSYHVSHPMPELTSVSLLASERAIRGLIAHACISIMCRKFIIWKEHVRFYGLGLKKKGNGRIRKIS